MAEGSVNRERSRTSGAVEGAVILGEVQPALKAMGALAADTCRTQETGGTALVNTNNRWSSMPDRSAEVVRAAVANDALHRSFPAASFPSLRSETRERTDANDMGGAVGEPVGPLALAHPAQRDVQGQRGDERLVGDLAAVSQGDCLGVLVNVGHCLVGPKYLQAGGGEVSPGKAKGRAPEDSPSTWSPCQCWAVPRQAQSQADRTGMLC